MKRPQSLAIVTLATALILALAPFAATPGLAQDAAADSGPRATVPAPVHDFGTVPKGQKLEHDFEIRNTGDEPLELTRVVPACGCTVARFDQTIAPGATGKVHADVDTSTLLGPTDRAISVYTSDPKNPVLRLTFKADVRPQVYIRPGYARYQVVKGETAPGLIKQTLYTGDGVDYEITEVETPWPAMTATVRKAEGDEVINYQRSTEGPQYVIEMKLDYNQLPTGPIAEELVLHTTHPVQKVVRIPVSGFVRPTMWVTPDKIEVGQIRLDDEPVDYTVVLQNFLAAPVEVTSVESDWDALKGEALVVNEGHKFHVRMQIDPEMPKGPFRGKVRINTTSDVMPVVEVPITGTIL
jgi:hypothetical protein